MGKILEIVEHFLAILRNDGKFGKYLEIGEWFGNLGEKLDIWGENCKFGKRIGTLEKITNLERHLDNSEKN